MGLLNQKEEKISENIYILDDPNKKCNITNEERDRFEKIESDLFQLFSKFYFQEE